MPFRLFQTLLAAGHRLRTREHVMAINAASFPYLDEAARKKAVAALESQADKPKAESASSTGDWDKLRGWVVIDALQHPVKQTPRKVED